MNEQEPPTHEPQAASLKCPLPRWTRRLGAVAFLFFLVKGLAWLAVPTLVAMGLLGR